MAKSKVEKEAGSQQLKNPKWELFCWLYAGYHNKNLFGNGTRCYMQAFGYNQEILKLNEKIEELQQDKPRGYTTEIKTSDRRKSQLRNIASVEGAGVLAKPSVRERVDFLLDQYLTHDFMDRELLFTAAQRNDLNSKVAAIREYNRLKERGKGGGIPEKEVSFTWEGDGSAKGNKKMKGKVTVKMGPTSKGADGIEWENEDD